MRLNAMCMGALQIVLDLLISMHGAVFSCQCTEQSQYCLVSSHRLGIQTALCDTLTVT